MASAATYRTAFAAGMRNFTAARSSSNLIAKTLAPKTIPTSPFFSSSSSPTRSAALRIASVLGSVESMMPLHSAIASARLKSNIAVDSSCWSWLSQDFAVPR